MLATVNAERGSRALEFGIYRDGDNNLDAIQALDDRPSQEHERAGERDRIHR